MNRRLIYGILGVAIFTGCAASQNHSPTVRNEAQKVMIAPSFNWQTLGTSGVAMLPVISDIAPEGVQNNAAYEVAQAFKNNLPNVPFLPVPDTMEVLRQNGVQKEFKTWFTAYQAGGPIDSALLHRVGQITAKRYLLLVEVKQYKDEWEPVETVYPRLPLTGPITSPSLTRPVSHDVLKDIQMTGRLWDSECRSVVWAGRGRAWVMDETPNAQVRMEDLFLTAVRNFTSSFLASGNTAKGGSQGC